MISVISKYWWAFALRGLLAILLGLVALIVPGWELYVFARVLCIYAVLDGLLAVIPSLSEVAEKTWWTLMVEGLIGLVVGVLTFLGPGGIGSALWPDVSSMVSLFVISSWAIVKGILEIIPGMRLPREFAGKWVLCIAGAVSVLFGGSALILRPSTGIVGAAWLLGIYAIAFGVLMILFGLKGRSISRPSQGHKERE
ncbi:MAG: DUF308 domain-containing protein [Deltaproteobacteria bacterium]|nr:DUF308 domain-containing protein [Deltaproteobacteria bacterium]